MNREFGRINFDTEQQKYYHAALMSEPAASHVIEDPFDFARTGGQLQGRVVIASLERLQDRLAENSGELAFTVAGSRDSRQRPQLEITLKGLLSLPCGRCLAAVSHPVSVRSRVLLAPPGGVPEGDDDAESPEWVEASRGLDVRELIEDELLLGLPVTVWHAQGKCSGGFDKAAVTSGSPFAVLASLRTPGPTTQD